MVVRDFDVICVTVLPDKAYTPFHVNGNRVLASAIVDQRMKPVAGRVFEVVKVAAASSILNLVKARGWISKGSLRLASPCQIFSASLLAKLRIIF